MKYLLTLILLIPICLHATIINVNHDGSGDYTTIQEGIDNASPGDTVLVYPGNYIETIDFLGKDIVVGSLFLTTQNTDFIEATIIDGNDELSQMVRFVSGETKAARLAGFTITNAAVWNKKEKYGDVYGLGVNINSSSPSIENNRIVDNTYHEWYFIGGGIALKNSSAKIIDNLISNNDLAFYGGGIYIDSCSNVLVKGNTITDHLLNAGYGCSQGGGICMIGSHNVSISNNHIEDNRVISCGDGGGIYLFDCDNILIMSNILSENGDDCTSGGGIYAAGSEIYMIGNLIINNRAESIGAGVYVGHCEVLMANNTICNNYNDTNWGKGGGIACNYSNPLIYNSIIYGNTATVAGNQVYLNPCSDPNFYYCDIEGGVDAFGLNDTVTYDGTYEHNIDLDPHFLLSGDHPYALAFNSPCINAGSPDTTGLMLPEFDLAGFDRIVQSTIDIGAYENQSHVSVSEIEKNDNLTVFPNPTTGKVIVSIPGREFETVEVFVEDMSGNRVFQTMTMQNETAIDLSVLKAGIYMMRIELSGDEFVNKIVIY